MSSSVGKSEIRVDAYEKAAGRAKERFVPELYK